MAIRDRQMVDNGLFNIVIFDNVVIDVVTIKNVIFEVVILDIGVRDDEFSDSER